MMLISCKVKSDQPKAELNDLSESVGDSGPETADNSPEKNLPITPDHNQEQPKNGQQPREIKPTNLSAEAYKVTFLEIGSVNCIPCRMMQPIMKEIAEEYKGIVKVEFYDLMG